MSSRAALVHRRGLLQCRQLVRAMSIAGSVCGSEGDHRPRAKAREWRLHKNDQLRKNRRDPELERRARNKQLEVPLDLVQSEWKEGTGRHHLRNIGLHCAIYQDVFGSVFHPRGFMDIQYSTSEDTHSVEQGNLLPVSCACVEPVVTLPEGLEGNYSTLLLTDPDGHLTNGTMELLHWMIADIPCGRPPAEGRLVTPYLQPIPPAGSGFHRYVFSLYTHDHPLSETTRPAEEDDWLKKRTFSTIDFLRTQPDLRPFAFSYFQSQWDSSVREAYSKLLAHPEPVYQILRTLTPRQARQVEIKCQRGAKYSVM